MKSRFLLLPLAGSLCLISACESGSGASSDPNGAEQVPLQFSLETPAHDSTGVVLSPTFTWTDSQNETHYSLEIREVASAASTVVYLDDVIAADSTSLDLPEGVLEEGKEYEWSVFAIHTGQETVASNAPWRFHTGSTPEGFELTYPSDNAVGVNLEASLSWQASSGSSSYVLEIYEDAGPFVPPLVVQGIVTGGLTEFQIPLGVLTGDTKYAWRVIAASGIGETESPVHFFTTKSSASDQATLKLNYDVEKQLGHEDFDETLFHVLYPDDAGPLTLGYKAERRPVVISLRGGNTNSVTWEDPPQSDSPIFALVSEQGWVGVNPNYPVIEEDEDYNWAAENIGLLVQFLRANHEWLNIDPEKVILTGRSFGGTVALAVCLKEDHHVPDSVDPFQQQSSRPDYCIALVAPVKLDCIAPFIGGSVDAVFFPNLSLSQATLEMKISHSANHWLVHPELFDREVTPPLCILYDLSDEGECGEVMDPHSGVLGQFMKTALEEFAEASEDTEFGESSKFIDTAGLEFEEAVSLMVYWAVDRLADMQLSYEGPVGSIGPATITVLEATPGADVFVYAGEEHSVSAIEGCPKIKSQISDWVLLGSGVASGSGSAEIWVTSFPQQASSPFLLQAVEFENCKASNLYVSE